MICFILVTSINMSTSMLRADQIVGAYRTGDDKPPYTRIQLIHGSDWGVLETSAQLRDIIRTTCGATVVAETKPALEEIEIALPMITRSDPK